MEPRPDELLVVVAMALAAFVELDELTPTGFEEDEEDELVEVDDDELVDDDEVTLAPAFVGTGPRAGKGPGL